MGKRGVNKVILVGNLGQDPETRFFPSGDAVTNFTIATSETWKDKQTGEQKEKTEWHRVAITGKLAEIAGEYLKKGSKVYIEGKLQTRKWENQQGQDQYTTEILVDSFNGEMQMVGGNPNANQGQQQSGGFQGQQQGGYSQPQQQYQQPQQSGGFNQAQQQGSQNLEKKRQAARANNQVQQPQQQQGGYANQGQQQAKVNPQEPTIDFDDDIPF